MATAVAVMPRIGVAQPMTCAPPPFDTLPRIADALAALAPVLDEYPDFQDVLDRSVAAICLTPAALDAQGYFEPETARIVLSDALSDGRMQAVLVHEMRHAAQFARGVCPAPDLAMRDYADAIFALEADASVTSVMLAHELRATGASEMWHALADWPLQADIAARYDAARAAGGTATDAATVAFDAWYLNRERRAAYYLAACADYLDTQDREHRLPSYERLPEGFFATLCRLPDGTAYPCAGPD
ncbi:DUF6782 family putative metallopeptidase [Jannaschia ovalis]|uniref:DUF6782 domain-containing protein n=1 Tax=Jannaschia ovalis TaxID=3038773 RepID=A0ABY8LJ13_9RHOB|nr:DUF6782 family putative metallopeptidase [Jannaschia sp. GRR-S6-38]WGH80150.1 hypothetical protein P8627_07765 [Jannaschia sp. GRR-S6-38]